MCVLGCLRHCSKVTYMVRTAFASQFLCQTIRTAWLHCHNRGEFHNHLNLPFLMRIVPVLCCCNSFQTSFNTYSQPECQDPRNTLWDDVSYSTCKTCYSGSAKSIIRAALCRLLLYSIRVRDQQFHFHLLCNLSERASDPLLVGRFSNTFCDQRRELDQMS
jgi:hypothetical protein